MIDTVALLLEREDFIISKPKRFNPSAEGLIHTPYYPASNQGFMKCVNNPSKDEIIKNGYLPRLTLFARNNRNGFRIQLKIEFSAPKILYGNNFDEICDNDFERLILELKIKLRIMGIVTYEDKLKNATVSAIHYSKNIILDKHTGCSFILNELRKVKLSKKLDLSNTDYRNHGHAVRYHTNSFEIVFYDKFKDLERSKISEKRCIDKDNGPQLDLFKKDEVIKKPEILRFEVRLSMRSLTKVLSTLDLDSTNKFEKLCNQSISRIILLHYINSIFESWTPINKHEISPENLYIEIQGKKNLKPNKILQLIGALYIINSIGYLGLRDLMQVYSDRTWYRLMSELKKIELKNNFNLMLMTDMINKIDKFETTRLKQLK